MFSNKPFSLQNIELIDHPNEIQVIFQGKEIGIARYYYQNTKENELYLSWIEINEKFQRGGIASKLLDYVCNKACKEDKILVINVVNEEVLDGFYFNWYKKHMNEMSVNGSKIKKQFNSFLPDENQYSQYLASSHPTLVFTPKDMPWVSTHKENLISKKSLS
jgi:hypothetical protein